MCVMCVMPNVASNESALSCRQAKARIGHTSPGPHLMGGTSHAHVNLHRMFRSAGRAPIFAKQDDSNCPGTTQSEL